MRSTLLALVAVACLAPAVRADQAEEIARLKEEVKKLRTHVYALDVEVQELKATVRALQAQLGVATPKPDPGPAGSYSVDRAHLEQLITDLALKEILKNQPDADDAARKNYLELIRPKAREQAKLMTIDMVLRPDGTFDVSGEMSGDKMSAKGTWIEKNGTLTLTTTHEDGKKRETPEIQTGKYANGAILLKPDDQPIEILLVRK